MYRGGLVTELDLDANSLSKTITKIHFNRIRGDIHQSARCKSSLEVFCAPLIRFVRFLRTHAAWNSSPGKNPPIVRMPRFRLYV